MTLIETLYSIDPFFLILKKSPLPVEGLWEGTHIMITDQLPEGIRKFQKLLWNRQLQGILEIQ